MANDNAQAQATQQAPQTTPMAASSKEGARRL